MSAPFVTVVIPAYNEERRITSTLEEVVGYLAAQAYAWDVVVADDGSADSTASLVQRFAQAHPQVNLLRLPHRGKGGAVRAGMLHATGQYRFLCDADLSMPVQQLDRFLPPRLTGCDVAVGSREAPGARRFDEPALRHLLGRGFNGLVRALAVRDLQDTQCGFKCFRAEAAERLFPLQRLFGFGFDVELLFLARRMGMRLVEVPIDWYYRRESKVRLFKDSLAMASDLLRVRWDAWRGRYGRLERLPGPEEPGRSPRASLGDADDKP
ncbi:MAG: glycosyltransferase family 2 protein [Chloroflexi bacterium]|nr:glycosyltransferase family 2 protein [Chloroflexota bacterium]